MYPNGTPGVPSEGLTDTLTDADAAAREILWIARESLAIMSEGILNDSPRGQAYTARKRALLAYIEATR